jgi:uncharacterized protein (TIGR02594 family)
VFVGQIYERPGDLDHPFIQWCHSLCGLGLDAHDEVAWCSSFVNAIMFLQNKPRTRSAAARSWLTIGTPVPLSQAEADSDVVIMKRGAGKQPGPEVIAAPGHVGLFAGLEGNFVLILGGNQGNTVSIARFPAADVLGVRRFAA